MNIRRVKLVERLFASPLLPQISNVHRQLGLPKEMHSPPSSDTSSISDATDILCAVSSGDFPGAASPLGVSALLPASLGMPGTTGTGESALLSWAVEDDDSRLPSSEREREECESGRGVISDASSKLSCKYPHD